MNGVLRFLLVLTYCAFGVLLIPFLLSHPEFAHQLQNQQPDFLVPYFLMEYFPKGILGILIAGFFAASMSSIDSALNSLSAATYQDFLVRMFPKMSHISDAARVRFSRWLTVFWGVVATGFALQMIGGPETVLELVNKIGSAFYGPILAVFLAGHSDPAWAPNWVPSADWQPASGSMSFSGNSAAVRCPGSGGTCSAFWFPLGSGMD